MFFKLKDKQYKQKPSPVGGPVTLWLVRSFPEQAVWVRALTGDTMLCSWARHYILTLPLSTQAYKRVRVNFILPITLGWTSIQVLVLQKAEISAGLMGHLWPLVKALPFTLIKALYKLCDKIASRKLRYQTQYAWT